MRREEGNRGQVDCSSRTGRVKGPASGSSIISFITSLSFFNVNITATDRINAFFFCKSRNLKS